MADKGGRRAPTLNERCWKAASRALLVTDVDAKIDAEDLRPSYPSPA
jgi:hypothetical protein